MLDQKLLRRMAQTQLTGNVAASYPEWKSDLKKGDKVKTSYRTDAAFDKAIIDHLKLHKKFEEPTVRECTVEYVEVSDSCQSGLLIKLEEFDEVLDSTWVQSC